MTTTEISPHLTKLNFTPSLSEQLLLPKIHDHNTLIVYSKEKPLTRILSLIILFYLNSQASLQTPPKILLLMKRGNQQKVQSLLKAHLDRSITVHNGSILPNARRQDYNRCSVILSTPKTVKNDLKEKYIKKEFFILVVIVDAKMGTSSSSLRFLMNKLKNNRTIGLTQETDTERLGQICKNLQLEEVQQLEEIQTRPEKCDIQHYSIPLPQEYFFILELLNQLRKHEISGLQNLGYDVSLKSTFRELTAIHESIKEEGVHKKHLVATANLLRIITLQKIIVSQGFPSALEYFDSLELRLKEKTNFQGKYAIAEFLNDIKMQKLKEFLNSQSHLLHPKSQMILKMIAKYQTGISIVTHNYYNANFLKNYLEQNGFSNVIQLEKPISSLSQLNLEKAILHFSEGKSDICISNSINDIIAQHAKVIIAYDVNAETIDKLNELNYNIPKVFLLAKQTNEEARFFYLKRLGSSSSSPDLDLNIINQSLAKKNQQLFPNTGSNTKINHKIVNEFSTNVNEDSRISLEFSTKLYEYGIPYSFPKTDFSIISDPDILFPGFLIEKKICILLIIPETLDFFISDQFMQIFEILNQGISNIFLAISIESFENLSFNLRYKISEIANKNNMTLFFLKENDDLVKLVKKIKVQLVRDSKR